MNDRINPIYTSTKRKSGVLMHISSLPGKYSCGTFGSAAFEFIDRLHDGGFSIWQVLPFSVPDEFGSPYKAVSAFAGNPYFIDPDILVKKQLLHPDEACRAEQHTPYSCEFERLSKERYSLLRLAASRIDNKSKAEIAAFIKEHDHIGNFCRYMASKRLKDGSINQAVQKDFLPTREDIFTEEFIQYEFYSEWMSVKSYAAIRGIEIIGDMPIYVDADSADAYYCRENFLLDADGRPEKVAGVPPDYFSPDGQLWGNPLYDWDYMKKDGYRWWLDRVEWQLTLFDGIRIDHFRAFSKYFAVDASEKTAKNGVWCPGPGLDFVLLLKKQAGNRLIIAEDLGDIDDEVRLLLSESGLPGMRVFQFAFLGADTPHMPHNYPENCVAYSGTHDNNTLLGYLWETEESTKRYMLEYCNHSCDWQKGVNSIIKAILSSHAARTIFPVQDLLGYGSDTRMNKPGLAEGNWSFRLTKEQIDSIDMNYYRHINEMYGRT